MGIEISNDQNSKLLMLNVYLPTCDDVNWNDFSHYMDKIDSIMSGYDSAYSLAMGDFNCNLHRLGANGHKFGDELLRSSNEDNLVISDLHVLHDDSYT